MLTPVFNKRNIRPRGGKIVLFKYFGLKIIVQKWRNGLKSSQVRKILGCDRKEEPIHGWHSLRLSKHARRIAEVRAFSPLHKIKGYKLIRGRSTVQNKSAGRKRKLVKEMGAGGITYIPLDLTVEGWDRITSAAGIDSVAGTCTQDNLQAIQRNLLLAARSNSWRS